MTLTMAPISSLELHLLPILRVQSTFLPSNLSNPSLHHLSQDFTLRLNGCRTLHLFGCAHVLPRSLQRLELRFDGCERLKDATELVRCLGYLEWKGQWWWWWRWWFRIFLKCGAACQVLCLLKYLMIFKFQSRSCS